jgi:hypothetical protein
MREPLLLEHHSLVEKERKIVDPGSRRLRAVQDQTQGFDELGFSEQTKIHVFVNMTLSKRLTKVVEIELAGRYCSAAAQEKRRLGISRP